MRLARVLPLLLALLPWAPLTPAAAPPAERGLHGMVVAPERLAAETGRDVLRDGGNAVDAAIATALVLSVTYPQAGSLGGGGFLLYRSPGGEYAALDFRETAPSALRAAMFLDESGRPDPRASRRSGLAVGVPGLVAGLVEAHRRWGSRPWAELVRPASRLASRGFPLSARTRRLLEDYGEPLAADPEAARVFAPGGGWPAIGEPLVQSDLARTLRRISREGAAGFYRGPVAEAVLSAVRRTGGVMTLEDLAAYAPREREPLEGSYRGYRIVTFPPPSAGGVMLLELLGMLERYDLHGSGPGSSLTVHRMVEAERRAFADRSRWLGDPGYWTNPVDRLLDPDYLAARAASIDDARATPSSRIGPGELPPAEPGETLHLSVADPRGGAVALTTTLNGWFGAGILAGGAGVLLNNEMDDFSLAPGMPDMYGLVGGRANAVEAGKRPLSSMAPTIVERDGGGSRPLLVLGSPGGSAIVTSVLQVLVNVIDHRMPLQEAVNTPRFHHQWQPDELLYEPRAFPADVAEALVRRGHRLRERARPLGNVNAIGVDEDGAWLGAADPRRGGAAEGY